MPIDRDQLLSDVKLYLGPLNVLPDEKILEIAESIIQQVGDDEENYGEVLCKTLQACAIQNQALAAVDPQKGVKREKSYQRELELHDNYNPYDYWKDYLDNLPKLCATFGYCSLPSKYAGMFKANVATPIRVPAGAPEYGTVERKANCDGEPCVPDCCDSSSFNCTGCDDNDCSSCS